jgi:hypothetical protein
MPIDFNIADDFAMILDGTEPATLKRRGSATTISVPKAWRYSSIAQAAEPGVAAAVQSDVVWQFGWSDSAEKLRVGDLLIDAAHECWTILSVEVRGNNSRLRCQTRNFRIAHELNNRIEIQQALWEDGESGPEITGWTTLRTAVPARIQPERTVVDDSAEAPTSTATYRVLLDDDTPLDHNHRILDAEGRAYLVLEYLQAERIDALPTAHVKSMSNDE